MFFSGYGAKVWDARREDISMRVLMGVPSYQLTTNFSANCQLTTNFS